MSEPEKDSVEEAIEYLPEAAAHLLLLQIAAVLYWDHERDGWNADKEWSTDELEGVAAVLECAGLQRVVREATK